MRMTGVGNDRSTKGYGYADITSILNNNTLIFIFLVTTECVDYVSADVEMQI